jgi:hypothetical protein
LNTLPRLIWRSYNVFNFFNSSTNELSLIIMIIISITVYRHCSPELHIWHLQFSSRCHSLISSAIQGPLQLASVSLPQNHLNFHLQARKPHWKCSKTQTLAGTSNHHYNTKVSSHSSSPQSSSESSLYCTAPPISFHSVAQSRTKFFSFHIDNITSTSNSTLRPL